LAGRNQFSGLLKDVGAENEAPRTLRTKDHAMTRFRPTVEPLDARALPSAVFTSYDDPIADAQLPAAQTVQLADASGDVATLGDVVMEARSKPKPPPPPPSPSEIPVTKTQDDSTTELYQ
jgi:hypothetical protein